MNTGITVTDSRGKKGLHDSKRDTERREYFTCPSPQMSNYFGEKDRECGQPFMKKGWVGSWGGMTQNHSNEYFRVTLTLRKAQGATKGIYNLLCCTWLQEVLLPWNTSPPPSRRGIKEIDSAWSRDGADILEFKDKKLDFFPFVLVNYLLTILKSSSWHKLVAAKTGCSSGMLSSALFSDLTFI